MHLATPLLAVAVGFATLIAAQDSPVPPELTLLFTLQVSLGEQFSIGPIPTGEERIVFPIEGGSFNGPKLNGEHSQSYTCIFLMKGRHSPPTRR